ncbi:hypothetical protein BH11GEM1_BH11GEM1_07310 [soil metagenome]
MTRTRLCIAAALSVAVACTSNPAPSGNSATTSSAARRSDVITAEELADPSVAAGDALEAVRRLRPSFLMSRGATSIKNTTAGSVHVSIDGAPLLTVDNLSRLRPAQILEIRYRTATDAAQQFGISAGGGAVILVRSR